MGTILLIDDSKLSRLKTSKYIRNAGYDVIEAENGQVGLELAIREHPDCIVCDILMPVMDGFEFTRRFLSQCPEVSGGFFIFIAKRSFFPSAGYIL